MSFLSKFAGIAAILIGFSSAQASTTIVLDFEDLADDSSMVVDLPGAYENSGFRIEQESNPISTSSGAYLRAVQASNILYNAGSTSLINGKLDTVSILTRIGGGTFGVTSIDLTGYVFDSDNGVIIFEGMTSDGNSIPIEFTTFGTASFDSRFSDIVKLSWSQDTDFTIDNVSLTVSSAVPEPSTWLMMLAGFAVTGFALRRRKLVEAFA